MTSTPPPPPPPPQPPPPPPSKALAHTRMVSRKHHSPTQSHGRRRACANCGHHGHVYRICNEPITSFGVICCRVRNDAAPVLEYLMVQRKDSMSYVEFVRGKYNLYNRAYILCMFGGMTQEERARLLLWSFEEIWIHFWQNEQQRSFTKDYAHSCNRFTQLREGIQIKSLDGDGGSSELFSIQIGMDATEALHADTEFGFPKGRRNMSESDIRCALREFSEETGAPARSVEIFPRLKPMEEQFIGSNGIAYRHCYFVANLRRDAAVLNEMQSNTSIPVNLRNCIQIREIKAIAWFDSAHVMANIREQYYERRLMFHNLDVSLKRAMTTQVTTSPLTKLAQSLRSSMAIMSCPPLSRDITDPCFEEENGVVERSTEKRDHIFV